MDIDEARWPGGLDKDGMVHEQASNDWLLNEPGEYIAGCIKEDKC